MATVTAMDKIRKPYLELDPDPKLQEPTKLIQLSDLKFFTVKLTIPVKNDKGLIENLDYGSIQVCSPVRKKDPKHGDLFIPASKNELWKLAQRLNKGVAEGEKIYPLTRAVADLAQNAATYVSPIGKYDPMQGDENRYDFVKYAGILLKTDYTDSNAKLVSGCHKYWLLSCHGAGSGKPVNYGFYADKKYPKVLPGGPYLKTYGVVNGFLAGHNNDFWDYSQLIQFMRCPRGIKPEPFLKCLKDKPLTTVDMPFQSQGIIKAANNFQKLANNQPPILYSLKKLVCQGYPGLWDEDEPGVTKRLTDAAFP